MNWKGKLVGIAGVAVLGLGISGGALAQDDKVVTVAVTQSVAGAFTYAFADTDLAKPLSAVEITGLSGGTATGSVQLEVKDTRLLAFRTAFNLQVSSTDFTAADDLGATVTILKSGFSSTAVTGTPVTGVTLPNQAGGSLATSLSVLAGGIAHAAFDTTTFTMDLSLNVPLDTYPEDYTATLTVTDANA